MMNQLMIDIETMGDISNSAIVSIAAVPFDLETGQNGRPFYHVVDLESCLKEGLKVTGGTIKWWLARDEKARQEICKSGLPLKWALQLFSEYVTKDMFIWSNGVRFDIALLEDAFIICQMEIPWDFRKERDVRTLVSFAPEIKEECQKNWKGVLHNPVDDCYLQIQYCSAVYNKLKI
jgi:hypothetical protein